MITIKLFTFNPFQENTYVLSDETGECVIIDPGMNDATEENILTSYLSNHQLKPVLLVNTHAHIDHIIGNDFVNRTFQLPLYAHAKSVQFLTSAIVQARLYGLNLEKVTPITHFLNDGDVLTFGKSHLQVLYTPGHADGSVCLYAADSNFVVTGDVLFYQSIGRTDLPTGDYDLLQESIWKKLFTLPDTTIVYPGHGPHTTIGSEKSENPFVAIGRDTL